MDRRRRDERCMSPDDGAAITGVRSATEIKSHGLAMAANSVIDSLTLGMTAGFVAVAAPTIGQA